MIVTIVALMRQPDTKMARDVQAHGTIFRMITTTKATSMTGMATTRTLITIIYNMIEIKVRVRRRVGAIIVDMVLTHHRRAPRTPSNILRMDVGTTHSEF